MKCLLSKKIMINVFPGIQLNELSSHRNHIESDRLMDEFHGNISLESISLDASNSFNVRTISYFRLLILIIIKNRS